MRQKNAIPKITDKDKKRFWSKVSITNNVKDCWEWQRGKGIGGYGNFDLRGITFRAHRVSFFINNGVDPQNLCVCHTCDNPSCVNPHHLFLGTDQDNVLDMHRKGRFALRSGEENKNSKLKELQVMEILDKHSKGIQAPVLSKEYGVKNSVIHGILNKKSWKHINVNYKKRELEYGNSKLNKSKVIEIKQRFANSDNTANELAAIFNISKVSVYNIIKGKTWQNIKVS